MKIRKKNKHKIDTQILDKKITSNTEVQKK